MTVLGQTAAPFRALAASCQAGALLLSFAVAHAQTPAAAPSQSAASKKTKPAPAKSATKPSTPAKAAAPVVAPKPETPAPAAPAPEPSSGLSPFEPVDTSKPPPSLPRASREKMRACAEEWNDLKRRTKVGELTWRVFATKCLTR